MAILIPSSYQRTGTAFDPRKKGGEKRGGTFSHPINPLKGILKDESNEQKKGRFPVNTPPAPTPAFPCKNRNGGRPYGAT
jgi:hypothetical protein